MHDGDYQNYVDGYQQLMVCDIRTSNVSIINQSVNDAEVAAHLIYRTGSNCETSEYDFAISLVYDGNRGSWLYNKTVVR